MRAQTKVSSYNGALIGYDSLTTYDAAHASDSAKVVNLKYCYSFPSITIKDTGSTIIDSIEIFKGHFLKSGAADSDAVFDSSPLTVKNPQFDNATVLTNGGKTATYIIMDGNIQLFKVVRINAVNTPGNLTEFFITVRKQ